MELATVRVKQVDIRLRAGTVRFRFLRPGFQCTRHAHLQTEQMDQVLVAEAPAATLTDKGKVFHAAGGADPDITELIYARLARNLRNAILVLVGVVKSCIANGTLGFHVGSC